MRDQPARFFLCARCRIQVIVCSHCDRGQRYCAGECASTTRRALQRDAGKRYQHGRPGRIKHALRTQSWRRRRAVRAQSVTHQGSPPVPSDAVLAADPLTVPVTAVRAPVQPCNALPIAPAAHVAASVAAAPPASLAAPITPDTWRCPWCGWRCLPRARQDFLHRARNVGPPHGHKR